MEKLSINLKFGFCKRCLKYWYPQPRTNDNQVLFFANCGHPTLVSVGKKTFKWYLKSEEIKKKIVIFFCNGNFRPFLSKMFKSETIFFHYFSQRILNLQIFWTSHFMKWGQKRRLSGISKREQTHEHTDKHTEGHFDL